jgi:hypothetical protein
VGGVIDSSEPSAQLREAVDFRFATPLAFRYASQVVLVAFDVGHSALACRTLCDALMTDCNSDHAVRTIGRPDDVLGCRLLRGLWRIGSLLAISF